MNLKKCDNGYYYDAEKFDICPHCYNSINTEDNDMVGGIVMRKCMWCGAENALHYSEKICPSCNNNLDGSHNEIINNAITKSNIAQLAIKNAIKKEYEI